MNKLLADNQSKFWHHIATGTFQTVIHPGWCTNFIPNGHDEARLVSKKKPSIAFLLANRCDWYTKMIFFTFFREGKRQSKHDPRWPDHEQQRQAHMSTKRICGPISRQEENHAEKSFEYVMLHYIWEIPLMSVGYGKMFSRYYDGRGTISHSCTTDM